MTTNSEISFIRIGLGDRFIRYHCDKCNTYHTQCIDAKCETLVRKGMKQNVHLILWCGKGEEPGFEINDGLTIKVVPVRRMSKKEQSKIRYHMKDLANATIGVNYGQDTPSDIMKFADEQILKIEERLRVLEGNRERIKAQKQKLEELLNLR